MLAFALWTPFVNSSSSLRKLWRGVTVRDGWEWNCRGRMRTESKACFSYHVTHSTQWACYWTEPLPPQKEKASDGSHIGSSSSSFSSHSNPLFLESNSPSSSSSPLRLLLPTLTKLLTWFEAILMIESETKSHCWWCQLNNGSKNSSRFFSRRLRFISVYCLSATSFFLFSFFLYSYVHNYIFVYFLSLCVRACACMCVWCFFPTLSRR